MIGIGYKVVKVAIRLLAVEYRAESCPISIKCVHLSVVSDRTKLKKLMRLYIFNPDTDLAVSADSAFYVPPASVRMMMDDLALLPLWYAEDGVVCSNRPLPADFRQLTEQLGVTACVSGPDVPFDYRTVTEVCPWGWNRTLVRQLVEAGVSHGVLPDEASLEHGRHWASRAQSIGLLQRLRQFPNTCGERFPISSLSQIGPQHMSQGGAVAKELWSSSGRGLCRFTLPLPPDRGGRIERWIRKHGQVVCEPYYDKVEDFAMEFRRDAGGQVHFCGYSLFKTDRNGAYDYNLLMSDEAIEQHLAALVGIEVLHQVRRACADFLTDVLGGYCGYLGIDMMVCREPESGRMLLHPCVEMNLRMNMGVLAHEFYRRWVVPGSRGKVGIVRFPQKGHLRIWSEALRKTAPLVVENGRVVRGGLLLTPVTDEALFGWFGVVHEAGRSEKAG